MVPVTTLVLETVFSISAIWIAAGAFAVLQFLLYFGGRMPPLAGRTCRVIAGVGMLFLLVNGANLLYPFHAVGQYTSCFGFERGWVPPGVLQHPSAKEIGAMTGR